MNSNLPNGTLFITLSLCNTTLSYSLDEDVLQHEEQC